MIELDWDSNVVWQHIDPMMHHDYARLPNGNYLYLAWDKLPAELNDRVQGGYRDAKDPDVMWADVINEITPDGTRAEAMALMGTFEFRRGSDLPAGKPQGVDARQFVVADAFRRLARQLPA